MYRAGHISLATCSGMNDLSFTISILNDSMSQELVVDSYNIILIT